MQLEQVRLDGCGHISQSMVEEDILKEGPNAQLGGRQRASPDCFVIVEEGVVISGAANN